MIAAHKFWKLPVVEFALLFLFAVMLIVCGACVAETGYPGPYDAYGAYGGPGPGYYGDYPWNFGANIDIVNGYGRGWRGDGWHGGGWHGGGRGGGYHGSGGSHGGGHR